MTIHEQRKISHQEFLSILERSIVYALSQMETPRDLLESATMLEEEASKIVLGWIIESVKSERSVSDFIREFSTVNPVILLSSIFQQDIEILLARDVRMNDLLEEYLKSRSIEIENHQMFFENLSDVREFLNCLLNQQAIKTDFFGNLWIAQQELAQFVITRTKDYRSVKVYRKKILENRVRSLNIICFPGKGLKIPHLEDHELKTLFVSITDAVKILKSFQPDQLSMPSGDQVKELYTSPFSSEIKKSSEKLSKEKWGELLLAFIRLHHLHTYMVGIRQYIKKADLIEFLSENVSNTTPDIDILIEELEKNKIYVFTKKGKEIGSNRQEKEEIFIELKDVVEILLYISAQTN